MRSVERRAAFPVENIFVAVSARRRGLRITHCMQPLVDARVLRPTQMALALKLVTETDLLRLKTIARLHARGLHEAGDERLGGVSRAALPGRGQARGVLRPAVDAARAERSAAHLARQPLAAGELRGAARARPAALASPPGTPGAPPAPA